MSSKPKAAPAPVPVQTTLTVEQWPIARPIPYAKNARKLTERAVEALAASIREFGFRQPIVCDEHDVIVVGHTRLLGAQKLGLETVPVHVAAGLTAAQCRAYRLADNRTAGETTWDLDLLATEMAELKAMEINLDLTGFEPREIIAFLKPPPATEEDDVPDAPAAPTSKAGDLWLCGPHRVMCGDSTAADAVARLCGADKADLVFTDPPYNVDYEGYTDDKLTIEGDKMSAGDFSVFLAAAFAACRTVVKQESSIYVCHSSSMQREFQTALEGAGFEVRCQIIWAKNTFAWGFGRYKFQHEPIFYAHVAKQRDAWYGDKSQSTLWAEKKPSAGRLHPTMKPVELIERALRNSSKHDDIVLDLFGGGGSTLIACEKTVRRALLMELDPRYADVIVARWQLYTGLQATLDGDGRAFAAIAEERK